MRSGAQLAQICSAQTAPPAAEISILERWRTHNVNGHTHIHTRTTDRTTERQLTQPVSRRSRPSGSVMWAIPLTQKHDSAGQLHLLLCLCWNECVHTIEYTSTDAGYLLYGGADVRDGYVCVGVAVVWTLVRGADADQQTNNTFVQCRAAYVVCVCV